MSKIRKTPGVYIQEKNAFPNSVVAVPTNVPAFIGYTEKASKGDQDLKHQPFRISSYNEFINYFGGAPKTSFNIDVADVNPGYVLTFNSYPFLLYNSMRFFFNNGGSICYVVSVGNYESEINKQDFIGTETDTSPRGINTLLKESEPSLLVIPDAVLLGKKDCSEVQRAMLKHCGIDTGNRFAILDIHDGYMENDGGPDDVISAFRDGIGNTTLDFGAAYYPWLDTSIVDTNEIDFENIDKKSHGSLIAILIKDTDASVAANLLDNEKGDRIKEEVAKLNNDEKDVKSLHQTLLSIHPLYKDIISSIIEKINLLPPSGAMAGIYAMVDDTRGVFKAPANVSVASVVKPAVNITHDEQEDLNIPINGKAVNAIRSFPGQGVLIWGARTLDGNSQDWRYINVRRTMIMIEQSVKLAAQAYVFEPNDASTWTSVKAMITSFLTTVWQEGGLAGATPEDAFSVDVGLGTTMTSKDILDGIMIVSVKVAVTRPAEFIVIIFEQKMAKA